MELSNPLAPASGTGTVPRYGGTEVRWQRKVRSPRFHFFKTTLCTSVKCFCCRMEEAEEVQLCFGRGEALGPPPKTASELDGILTSLDAGGKLAVVGGRLTFDSISDDTEDSDENAVAIPAHLDLSPRCLERKVDGLLALFRKCPALAGRPLLIQPSPTPRYRLRTRFGIHVIQGKLTWYTFSVRSSGPRRSPNLPSLTATRRLSPPLYRKARCWTFPLLKPFQSLATL